jgi:rod shape-determining protein MreC
MRILTERWKPLALFLCLLLLALVLTTWKTRRTATISVFESLVMSVVMPVQEATISLLQHAAHLWHGYVHLTQVRRENRALQRQLEALQGQLYRYEEAYLQQQRLRELLGLRSLDFPHPVVAEVVGIDPSQWAEAITINQGSRQNLGKDLAVMTHQGLVGRLIGVTPHYATVLLLTDRRSAVDALVQRTRARGIVVGKSRRLCEMRYVEFHEDIRVGDTVISSGFGGVYPKGLAIGTVTAVRQEAYGFFHEVEIKPAVDFARLEEVLVLVP